MNANESNRQQGPLLVGCGAGFSGDRTDAAGPVVDALAASGGPAVLIFETLAERTLALAQLARKSNPKAGYEPLLDDLLRPILGRCLQAGIRIVSNFGAANPAGAAVKIQELAAELGLREPRVAVVEGDDLTPPSFRSEIERALGSRMPARPIVSANAYIGADAIADALAAGADVVVCGRVADPSLTVGPALWHFGWSRQDWDRIAGATMAGHLLECGAQVTGGYYADPGFKDVDDLAFVGFPTAEIAADGSCVISKAPGTGGRVDEHTVKEQLLYELHDPAAYLTPDVVADISEAQVDDLGGNRVRLSGVRGHPRPDMLKVNVCHENGWLAEAEISYAGARAEGRARMAADILEKRIGDLAPLRIDLIGITSILDGDARDWRETRAMHDARDVRLRAAANVADLRSAERLAREVFALHTCGPAAAGGGRSAIRPRLATLSCLLPREIVPTRFHFAEHSGATTEAGSASA